MKGECGIGETELCSNFSNRQSMRSGDHEESKNSQPRFLR